MYTYDDALEASIGYFDGDDLAAKVFLDKYSLRNNEDQLVEKTPEDMHRRISREFARIEKDKFKKPLTEEFIFSLLDKFKYIIPQGSPMYGIGNTYKTVSLSNCYVLDLPLDSYSSILQIDEQLVNISKRRGGVGIDLSNLRPAGAPTKNSARSSTGIVTWMERYSNSIREVGQCIAAGQEVLTKRGLISIENISPNKDEVWTKKGWVKVLDRPYNGIKEVYRVTTSSGYSVIVSEDHIFQTYDTDGQLLESRLKDLDVDSPVVLIIGDGSAELEYQPLYTDEYKNTNNKPSNCILPKILDEKLGYILGYSYGDGYVGYTKYGDLSLSLACSNDYQEIKNKLNNYIKDVFDYDVCINDGDGDLEELTICNKTIIQFLKFNSILKQKAESLIFPQLIKKSPTSVQLAFLSGYFDADGDNAGKKAGYRFRSINAYFLKECQKVLSSIGIQSKVSIEYRADLGWQDLYTLGIVGQSAQARMVALFQEAHKVSSNPHISKRDCWLTPFKAKSFDIKHNKYSYCPDNSQYLSLYTVNKLAFDGEKVNSTLLQDTIQSIDFIGVKPTYDLTLEQEYLFWCEGLYVHNSARRGALMLTLSIHHPDVEAFISIKNDETKVTGANISLRLSDEFLKAVEDNTDYELRFPVDSAIPKISKLVSAREIWTKIIHSAWFRAEPGLLFWDNFTKYTPADCYERYASKGTNPCAELNLSPLDSCRLLCQNLYSYVMNPFTDTAYFDYGLFKHHAKIAQRLMDDLVDLESECIARILEKVKNDPEPDHVKQKELWMWEQIKKNNDEGRRTGTGITGLGDCLAALGIKYGSEESIIETEEIYRTLKLGCYESSVDMAEELGTFKEWDWNKEKDCPFIARIENEDKALFDRMSKVGRRNISLLTTAPTGTVSCETRTTSGFEPAFKLSYTRRKKINPSDQNTRVDFVDKLGDKWQEFEVYHPKVTDWMRITGKTDIKESPWWGCCAEDIDWINRVKMQAAAQRHVCHAISSTVNLPESATEAEVAKIYETAWKFGCKGITVYRENCRTGVLVDKKDVESKKSENSKKRPQEVPGEIYHIKVKGQDYFAIVGLLENEPYEIFAGKNGHLDKKHKHGIIKKTKRGEYQLLCDDEIVCPNIANLITENEEGLTRIISTSLRHGVPLQYVVHQLEKVEGDMQSFARSISRALKKYVKDGEKVTGEACPSCQSDNMVRQEGCITCLSCGNSKCG